MRSTDVVDLEEEDVEDLIQASVESSVGAGLQSDPGMLLRFENSVRALQADSGIAEEKRQLEDPFDDDEGPPALVDDSSD